MDADVGRRYQPGYVEARIVVASIETYMRHANVIGHLGPLAAPALVELADHGERLDSSP